MHIGTWTSPASSAEMGVAHVAHPAHPAAREAIASARMKKDKVDARTLALLLPVDLWGGVEDPTRSFIAAPAERSTTLAWLGSGTWTSVHGDHSVAPAAIRVVATR